MIHSNQHYSENMDKVFFNELNLPHPNYNLNAGSGKHGKQTGLMLEKIEFILELEKPDIVIVQGDTNTVLAGALAASKMNIKVGHVEAGLRSYDRKMPEETNRIIVDHISDLLFCPTEKQKLILKTEGINENKINVVGNTIVDTIIKCETSNDILKNNNLETKAFILLTMHRQENVGKKEKLKEVMNKIETLKELNMKVIFPIHPRTKKMCLQFEINIPGFIKLIPPVNYSEMVTLEKNSFCIITDSGGIQEEACILKIPCITIRNTTERPETIEVGANKLATNNLIDDVKEMTNKKRNWVNPFGKGDSSEKILRIIQNETH